MQGGHRTGAGRKKGFAAKNAEEARKMLSERVAQEIGPISDILTSRAKQGDIRATQILFDRAWGKPRQEVELRTTELETSPEDKEKLQELSGIVNELLKLTLTEGISLTDALARFKDSRRTIPAKELREVLK